MNGRRLLASGLAAAALVALTAPPAGATARVHWQPYRTAPFTSAAGQNCRFPLRGEPVIDHEEIATLARFADGSPRLQQIRGDLVVRYTNVDTGRSARYDLGGIGTVGYASNGATTLALQGPGAVGFAPSDPYPAGFYVLDGVHVVYTGPDRNVRVLVVDAGTEHDVCADLS